MKQINSLLTVKFFNVVQKYANDSRFCSISTREIVSKRRSSINTNNSTKVHEKNEAFYQLDLFEEKNDHFPYLNLNRR